MADSVVSVRGSRATEFCPGRKGGRKIQKRLTLKYANKHIEVRIAQENLIYSIKPKEFAGVENEEESVLESLRNPIDSPPLSHKVKKGMKVVVIGDDITRITPRRRVFPLLLNELNQAGVPDRDITILIALGTHRYMRRKEIEGCFGKKVVKRVRILNHEWKDETNLIRIGASFSGIPAEINRVAYEADYLIGVGSIVPHDLAGYGGGAKIVQPGICSWKTTGRTHLLPAKNNSYTDLLGNCENEVRLEIEEIARIAGLDFIVNVVLNHKEEIVKVVSGDIVRAHREGVRTARMIYERSIPELADIVITSAYPAEIDYWQGTKPLSYAQRGLREGGTVILLGSFPDGISPSHPQFEEYGDKPYRDIVGMIEEGKIQDLVCASALLQHALIVKRSRTICVSDGLSAEQKKKMTFRHADSAEQALQIALGEYGKDAKIGVIDHGGEVMPQVARLAAA